MHQCRWQVGHKATIFVRSYCYSLTLKSSLTKENSGHCDIVCREACLHANDTSELEFEWYQDEMTSDGRVWLGAMRYWRELRERTGHGCFRGQHGIGSSHEKREPVVALDLVLTNRNRHGAVLLVGQVAPDSALLQRVFEAGDATVVRCNSRTQVIEHLSSLADPTSPNTRLALVCRRAGRRASGREASDANRHSFDRSVKEWGRHEARCTHMASRRSLAPTLSASWQRPSVRHCGCTSVSRVHVRCSDLVVQIYLSFVRGCFVGNKR